MSDLDKKDKPATVVVAHGSTAGPANESAFPEGMRIKYGPILVPKDRCGIQSTFNGDDDPGDADEDEDRTDVGMPSVRVVPVKIETDRPFRYVALGMIAALGIAAALWFLPHGTPHHPPPTTTHQPPPPTPPSATLPPPTPPTPSTPFPLSPSSLTISSMGPRPACTAECAWANLAPNGFPKSDDAGYTVRCADGSEWRVRGIRRIEKGAHARCYAASGITAP